jgi:hypothetical protein
MITCIYLLTVRFTCLLSDLPVFTWQMTFGLVSILLSSIDFASLWPSLIVCQFSYNTMNAVCWYESQKQYQLEDHVLNREISGQKQLDSNISHIEVLFLYPGVSL